MRTWLIAYLALAICGGAHAQSYPQRAITIVVPVTPGGSVDTLARILAERLRTSLGEPVIVENVTGAGGSVGVARVARAAPDGYTLSLGNWTTHVGAGAVYPVNYDALSDLEPVARLTDTSLLLVGRINLPAKNVKELAAWLKENPGKASAATIGVGSPAHLCTIAFENTVGTKLSLVPYRGGAPAIQDVVAGQVDLFCGETSVILPHVRSGAVTPFAVASKSRWFAAPEIMTMAEAGVENVDLSIWHAMWAPSGTPRGVISRLHTAIEESLADQIFRQRLADLGHQIPPPDQRTPEALRAHHATEIGKWWPIIKASGLKAP